MQFNTAIWKYKRENNIALNEPLDNYVYAPRILRPLKEDLEAMHRIKEIRFESPPVEGALKVGSDIYIAR